MTFADPAFLLLLGLIPLLVWLARRRAALSIGFPATGEIGSVRPSLATRLHRALPWLRALIIALAIVALARPQWGAEVSRVRREGIAIAMVVDTSSSMRALDLRLEDRPSSRLDAVKATFRDFIAGGGDDLDGRAGDSIGMVTFARFADSLAPPTLDHDALITLLDRVAIVDRPLEDGTAIGDAILRGIEMLRQVDTKSRVMILLTDGSNNVGVAEPLIAAQIAAALRIKIYTIGAGTNGTALIPVSAADGAVTYRESEVAIDETTLGGIAQLTGGRFFRATDGAALREIYAEIDALEKTRNLVERFQLRYEAFPWLIGLTLVLLVGEVVLVNTRLRQVP